MRVVCHLSGVAQNLILTERLTIHRDPTQPYLTLSPDYKAHRHSIPKAMNQSELLAIGHVTWDVSNHAHALTLPGGAASFAAITAGRLGVQASIITSCDDDDYPFDKLIANNQEDRLANVQSHNTTTFKNIYDTHGHRQQHLISRAANITLDHLPEKWLAPEMLFVAPLTQEIPTDCLSWFNPRVSCIVPQGWLREWNLPLPSPIRINPKLPAGISRGWDICVLSDDEVNNDTLDDWLSIADILVVTKGAHGSTLYLDKGSTVVSIPSSYADKVPNAGFDTTGAGDVFAAAMLINYTKSRDPVASAYFASACAALSTTDSSWNAVPTADEAQALLEKQR